MLLHLYATLTAYIELLHELHIKTLPISSADAERGLSVQCDEHWQWSTQSPIGSKTFWSYVCEIGRISAAVIRETVAVCHRQQAARLPPICQRNPKRRAMVTYAMDICTVFSDSVDRNSDAIWKHCSFNEVCKFVMRVPTVRVLTDSNPLMMTS